MEGVDTDAEVDLTKVFPVVVGEMLLKNGGMFWKEWRYFLRKALRTS